MKRICLLFFALPVFMLPAQEMTPAERPFTIVVDAGHGGHDPGATGRMSKEKDINLAVMLLLGKKIEENHPATKIIYTRKTDVFVPLYKRAKIANEANADVFISIHTNATPKGSLASGTETYVLGADKSEQHLAVAMLENSAILYEDDHAQRYDFDPNNIDDYIALGLRQNLYMTQSINYAQAIQNNFQTLAGRKDRGVRQAGFLVLLNTTMPSVLVELGYINNPAEERYLNSAAGKEQLADAIYKAFLDFKDEYARKTQNGFTAGNNKEVEENIEKQPTKEKTNPFVNDRIVYQLQILTSNIRYPEGNAVFKNLSPVIRYKDGEIYRYIYGESSDIKDIATLKNAVKTLFANATVVAFDRQEGKYVSPEEIIQIWQKNKK
ncbi:MAG: N-acetylmuramoyl-L-alanine amidase [Prevotellaceae bacterium]|jgi:N-acetylmuramoyl-L-alanine amidase|nr:N-acetylmuramoyl-L-alanine amidase [Prevotellaceae bacterium]